MLKDFRCGHCKRLLARMGENTELQIKCARCGTLNHVKAVEPRVDRHGATCTSNTEPSNPRLNRLSL
ncbi:Com family DNA-binding transcriptional regulator [Pseudomonas sp. ICMP22404]|uniref:Com family DNA-binding transcriptional regulator n=1 Tax=Pseudomonas sp. ICMP22404 TaxID=2583807 RepID=UPI001118E616|nr:Com family DNA-binding transcriptional regulator [Pseudomonas sp. ICMP22404]TNF81077.1 Com family DNA-binding transcriptional regulator [Pseudomonas sp. ICMP22404]